MLELNQKAKYDLLCMYIYVCVGVGVCVFIYIYNVNVIVMVNNILVVIHSITNIGVT